MKDTKPNHTTEARHIRNQASYSIKFGAVIEAHEHGFRPESFTKLKPLCTRRFSQVLAKFKRGSLSERRLLVRMVSRRRNLDRSYSLTTFARNRIEDQYGV